MNIYHNKNTFIYESDDSTTYDIMKDLRCVSSGEQLPKHVKETVYRGIYFFHDEVWSELIKEAWFNLVYSKLIRSVTTEPKQVERGEIMSNAVQSVNVAVNELGGALVEAIINQGTEQAVQNLERDLTNKIDTYINDNYGVLPKKLTIKALSKSKVISGVFHEKFQDILTMVTNNIPVMLVGQAGTGKNHTLQQVAEALELGFYYTGAVTQEYKVTGFIDANGKYHETEFYKAFTGGGVFMLDEVDASAPEVLVLLNGAIANGYFDFPTGRVTAHDDFRVVCAGNTYGNGADIIYVGRNVLDGATLDRFVVIKMDYDKSVERSLCPNDDLRNFILEIRRTVERVKLRFIVGMRTSINAHKAHELNMNSDFIFESVIFKSLKKDDLGLIINKMNVNKSNIWFDTFQKYYDDLR